MFYRITLKLDIFYYLFLIGKQCNSIYSWSYSGVNLYVLGLISLSYIENMYIVSLTIYKNEPIFCLPATI